MVVAADGRRPGVYEDPLWKELNIRECFLQLIVQEFMITKFIKPFTGNHL